MCQFSIYHGIRVTRAGLIIVTLSLGATRDTSKIKEKMA
jgi:hypothetical protein